MWKWPLHLLSRVLVLLCCWDVLCWWWSGDSGEEGRWSVSRAWNNLGVLSAPYHRLPSCGSVSLILVSFIDNLLMMRRGWVLGDMAWGSSHASEV